MTDLTVYQFAYSLNTVRK